MKYTNVQVDVYEVDLPDNHRTDFMYDNMMATVNETVELVCENSDDKNSMVSNLPLLFADGYPTSLEKMTMTQLENFVIFMIECSLGYDINEVINKPMWWPKEVKFSNPLIRPKNLTDTWMANLKNIVLRCYMYHKSEYLLRFCSYLAQYPYEELEYVNNWDFTTSLYHKSSRKLLVTFRNENMNYDKKNENPRKTLLSPNGITSNFTNKSKQQAQSFTMVQPLCDDIYLCDNCDAEFVGLEKMKEHELARCDKKYQDSNNSSRPSTPNFLVIKSETNQTEFLEYLQLRSREKETKVIVPNENEEINNKHLPTKTSSLVRGSINLTKSRTIPFSSPAGMILAKKCKTMTEETQQERLERIERHVIAPPITSSFRPKWLDEEDERGKWLTTYKFNRDKQQIDYVHRYKFSDALKGKPVLNIKSQILFTACRPVFVTLAKLNQKQIDDSKQNSLKHRTSYTKRSHKKAGPASKTTTKLKISDEIPVKKMITKGSMMSITQYDTTFVTSVNSDSLNNSITDKDSFKKVTPCSIKQKSVQVIDLCSSDEDEISKTTNKFDENTDPINSILDENSLSANKVCSKACIYPANTANHWLMKSIFTEDNDNHVNRCHIGGVLNTCIQISPVLRPAP